MARTGEDACHLGRQVEVRLLALELVDEGEETVSCHWCTRHGVVIASSVWTSVETSESDFRGQVESCPLSNFPTL